ncbi:MAG: hypothetical protein ACR2IF_10920 [Terriglobales bacterium]
MLEDITEVWRSPWQPLGRQAVIAWLIAYALFLLYAARSASQYLFIDNANLVVHEAGHLLVGWTGNQTLTIWGGSLLQWAVPLLLAAWFFGQRQIAGYALCLFLFFENLLYSATYMADARAMVLPLVTVGDADNAGHDWNYIFSTLGLLDYDSRIAAFVRLVGWAGMIAVMLWLALRLRPESAAQPTSP